MSFFDDFSGNAIGTTPSGWTGTLPTVTLVGRDGSKGVRKLPFHSMRRENGSTYLWAVLKVDNPGQVVSAFNASAREPLGSLTCRQWLIGCGQDNVAHLGVCVTADGALHLHRGTAYDSSPNNQYSVPNPPPPTPCITTVVDATTSQVLASTASGVFRFTGWQFLELFSTSFSALVRVNNQTVLSYNGNTRSYAQSWKFCGLDIETWHRETGLPYEAYTGYNGVELYSVASQFWAGIGGESPGAKRSDEDGWGGYVDAVGAITPGPNFGATAPLGDLRLEDLTPTGSAGTPVSTISGTTPAGTRAASVDDWGTPDDGVTSVSFAAGTAGTVDRYTTDALDVAPGTSIIHVQGALRAKPSQPGYAVPRVGLTVDGVSEDISTLLMRSRVFRDVVASLERPGGGAWAPEDFLDAELRIGRTA